MSNKSSILLLADGVDEELSKQAAINYEPVPAAEVGQTSSQQEDDTRPKPRYAPGSRKGVGGRISVEKLFPTLVPEMTSFIEANGFTAHRRRQETTGSCGVTLDQIQKYLFQAVPGLKDHGCSIHTISRLLQAPDRRFRASQSYRGCVDAKANPPKRTGVVRHNANDHFYSARTKYVMEFATQFSNAASVYSVDNKNKLRIGDDISAVDRRCQNNRIFPVNDQPILPDHDFHSSALYVQIPGYLHIDLPQEEVQHVDDKGRNHFRISRRGQLHVVNRSGKNPMTIAEHVNDILGLLDERPAKPVLILVADNGCDFRPNNTTNEVCKYKVKTKIVIDRQVTQLSFEHDWF